MTETLNGIALPPPFPDHTQLPESDGSLSLTPEQLQALGIDAQMLD